MRSARTGGGEWDGREGVEGRTHLFMAIPLQPVVLRVQDKTDMIAVCLLVLTSAGQSCGHGLILPCKCLTAENCDE